MKRSLILSFGILVAGMTLGAGTISGVTVTQNWPWDKKVFIDYTLTGDAGQTYDIDVKIESVSGSVVNLSGAIKGETTNVEPGTYRLTWDPARAVSGVPDAIATGFKFIVSCLDAPTPGKYMVLNVSDPGSYTVSYLNDVPAGGWTDDHKKSMIPFRRIRPGVFMMGSPSTEESHIDVRNSNLRGADRYPEIQHQVTLTNDYWIAVFPATDANISYLDTLSTYNGDGTPRDGGTINYGFNTGGTKTCRGLGIVRLVGAAYGAAWPTSTDVDSASLIGQVRSRLEGKNTPPGLVFYIPTEAQWEYACRAGTTTAWNNGADCATNAVGVDANLNLLGLYTPVGSGTAFGNVGQKLPNAWGLYDCHGNIGELTADGIDTSYTTAVIEPATGRSANLYCVVRGGCYVNAWAVHCRSAARIMSNQYTSRNSAPADGACWFWQTARFAFIRPRQNNRW